MLASFTFQFLHNALARSNRRSFVVKNRFNSAEVVFLVINERFLKTSRLFVHELDLSLRLRFFNLVVGVFIVVMLEEVKDIKSVDIGGCLVVQVAFKVFIHVFMDDFACPLRLDAQFIHQQVVELEVGQLIVVVSKLLVENLLLLGVLQATDDLDRDSGEAYLLPLGIV